MAPSPALDVFAAGCGSAITDTLFNPLELTKVRIQLDHDRRMYRHLGQSASLIVAEEGLLGFWLPGLPATWLRAYVQTGLRVGLYPTMKASYSSVFSDATSDSLLLKVASGATTGAVGAAIGSPVDMVRVKLQGESGRIVDGIYTTGLRAGHAPRHAHTLRAFRDIAQNEGVAGLWRGVSAAMLRVALLSAAQLSTYDHAKQIALRSGWLAEGPQLHICCSSLSGFVAQAACMPADVVKTRVQSGFGGEASRSPLKCLRAILRHEGPLGLYRGFSAAAARQVPVMTVQMPIVEQIRRALGLGYL